MHQHAGDAGSHQPRFPLRTPDPRIATALASSLAASAAVIAAFGVNAVGGACLLEPKSKRPRYNNSACLAAIGVTNAWADSALCNHTYEQLAATRMSSLHVTAFSPSMQSSSDRRRSWRQHTVRHLNPYSLSRCPIASFPLSTTASTTSMRQ